MASAFIKLPFTFNKQRLVEDYEICQKNNFIAHFNDRDFDGAWTSIALRSIDGKVDTIFAHNSNNDTFKDTQLLQDCTYFKYIIDSLQCEKESIRLLKLGPHSHIKPHTDFCLSYEEGTFRVHIPIMTHDKIIFNIDGKQVKMREGECWYGNFSKTHFVENNGTTDRVHLVLDCKRNAWTDNVFKAAGYDFTEDSKEDYDITTKRQIIEQLKLMDTPASKALIKQYEDEIKKIN